MKRYFEIFLTLLLFIYTFLFFLQKINLTNIDLGRHLVNGKLMIENFNFKNPVLTNNLYSYTQPNYPFINHHWLSGVVFYLVYAYLGFNGLAIFYALLSAVTILIFFKISLHKANFYLSLLVTVLCVPLFASRTEVRPEVFSYLFMAVLVYILCYSKNKYTTCFTVLFIQLLWVNMHIFFVFGILILAVFTVHVYLNRVGPDIPYPILLAGIIAICLFNPHGMAGLLTPLNIFKEYGYRVAENQSIFFMQKLLPSFSYFYAEILILVTFGLSIWAVFEKRTREYLFLIILTLIFGLGSLKMIRIIPIFSLFCIILCTQTLQLVAKKYILKNVNHLYTLGFAVVVFIFSPFKFGWGLGVDEKSLTSAQFFKMNNIKGPIFNNYDIGSYLVYSLYPSEKVFVDNRPEAYYSNFFEHTYVPIQESEEMWKKAENEYKFNVIYFYRRDYTPWAQIFLIKRIKDVNWAPVYVDDYTIILLKKSEENREVIEKYELPQDMFSII